MCVYGNGCTEMVYMGMGVWRWGGCVYGEVWFVLCEILM